MITFSGLLNALDGVAAAEERIIFMTTNHIDRLDPALIRPGRVDMKVLLENASEHQILSMFDRFYVIRGKVQSQTDSFIVKGEDPSTAQDFLKEMKRRGMVGIVSTATLQGHFVRYRDDPVTAIKNVSMLVEP